MQPIRYSITILFIVTCLSVLPVRCTETLQTASIPPHSKQDELIKDTMRDFAKAINTGDFKQFHSKLAKPFREMYKPDFLKDIFSNFIEQKMDLTVLGTLSPLLNEEPTLDKDGVLTLVGHYNTSPSIVFFELKYYEYPEWKLLSIEVKIRDNPEYRMPSEKRRAEMVKETMHDFALAVNSKDFTNFHSKLSKPFREAHAPSKLKEVFQSFIDQEMDLTILDPMQPIFHKEATLDENDILTISGHYDTQPNIAKFRFQYYERPYWKLFLIEVNVE
ncbi:MAG: hypothetical protein CR997_05530 [Acidobacteria bacterium]|nr:MAG: hypothetical protein CR997_05530 [Acidobacteriota bacterium]